MNDWSEFEVVDSILDMLAAHHLRTKSLLFICCQGFGWIRGSWCNDILSHIHFGNQSRSVSSHMKPMKLDENVFFSRLRGTLFSLFDPIWNSGTVMAFVLAKYFDYATQAKINLVMPILFVILFARMPDTPQHLVNVERQKVIKWDLNNYYYLYV